MQLAIVLAGGSGERSGAEGNKVLANLDGVPILRRSVEAMIAGGAEAVVVVVRPADTDDVAIALAGITHVMVEGGPTRQSSEVAGLAAAAALGASAASDVIAIHDAARPLASADLIATVFAAAKFGAAWPAIADDNVWMVEGGRIAGRVDAQLAQTPQAARADFLHRAYALASSTDASDTIAVVQAAGEAHITIVEGEPTNIKVTWPDDFAQAESILAGQNTPLVSTLVDHDDTETQPNTVPSPSDDPGTATSEVEAASATESEIDLSVLVAAESELDDIEAAMRCVAITGTAHDPACTAAIADGTLADRPPLARCVAAKQD
ncbi:MAG: IspD/TarI family cytidylyltransferase [Acidimicrobiales bacterium]